MDLESTTPPWNPPRRRKRRPKPIPRVTLSSLPVELILDIYQTLILDYYKESMLSLASTSRYFRSIYLGSQTQLLTFTINHMLGERYKWALTTTMLFRLLAQRFRMGDKTPRFSQEEVVEVIEYLSSTNFELPNSRFVSLVLEVDRLTTSGIREHNSNHCWLPHGNCVLHQLFRGRDCEDEIENIAYGWTIFLTTTQTYEGYREVHKLNMPFKEAMNSLGLHLKYGFEKHKYFCGVQWLEAASARVTEEFPCETGRRFSYEQASSLVFLMALSGRKEFGFSGWEEFDFLKTFRTNMAKLRVNDRYQEGCSCIYTDCACESTARLEGLASRRRYLSSMVRGWI